MAATMAGTFRSAIATSMIGTAMPTIVSQPSGLSIYSRVFSASQITPTTTVPLIGPVNDLYRREPIYILATAIVTVAFQLGTVEELQGAESGIGSACQPLMVEDCD